MSKKMNRRNYTLEEKCIFILIVLKIIAFLSKVVLIAMPYEKLNFIFFVLYIILILAFFYVTKKNLEEKSYFSNGEILTLSLFCATLSAATYLLEEVGNDNYDSALGGFIARFLIGFFIWIFIMCSNNKTKKQIRKFKYEKMAKQKVKQFLSQDYTKVFLKVESLKIENKLVNEIIRQMYYLDSFFVFYAKLSRNEDFIILAVLDNQNNIIMKKRIKSFDYFNRIFEEYTI